MKAQVRRSAARQGTTIDGTIAGAGSSFESPPPDSNLNFNPAAGAADPGGAGKRRDRCIHRPQDLTVAVSDPNNDNLTVTFYGRVKGAAGSNFTIAALPDTQVYSQNASYPSNTASQRLG